MFTPSVSFAADSEATALDISCSTRHAAPDSSDCSLVVQYSDGTAKYYASQRGLSGLNTLIGFREPNVKSTVYTTNQDSISTDRGNIMITAGKQSGYESKTVCDGDSCMTISLKNKPSTTTAATVVQIPQTGDPASSVWQWASSLAAISCIGMAVLTVFKQRDRQDNL